MSLCCKTWNKIALERIYEQITLNGKKILKLKKILHPQQNNQLPKVAHGELVKCLKFLPEDVCGAFTYDGEDYRVMFSQQEFHSLLTHLRNIKAIDLQSSLFGIFCFNFFVNILENNNNTTTEFLQHVENIQTKPDRPEQGIQEEYYKVCFTLRNKSLNTLGLREVGTIFTVNNRESYNLLGFLPSLKI